jgi:hypothetical protein
MRQSSFATCPPYCRFVADWLEIAQRAEDRYRDGEARLGDARDSAARQRQLLRMASAAAAVGYAQLMRGARDEASTWLVESARRYRESWEGAPADSWGRPIGAMKALAIAGDWRAAEDAAAWTLSLRSVDAASPIGRYSGALALLVLRRNEDAQTVAATLRARDDFPHDVAEALAAIANGDAATAEHATDRVLTSFEERDAYLEDVPIADTALVLHRLGARRGFDAPLRASPLLPTG